MKKLAAIIILVMAIFVSGCAFLQKEKPTGGYWKSTDREQIAILPFVVHSLSDSIPRFNAVDELKEADRGAGILLQRDFYRYCLRHMNKFEYNTSFIQDPNDTNAKLKSLQINYADIEDKDLAELSEILEVDGLVCGYIDHRYADKRTISGIFNGGLQGQVLIESNIYWYDVEKERRRWRYKAHLPKSGARADYDVTKDLLRDATSRFPY